MSAKIKHDPQHAYLELGRSYFARFGAALTELQICYCWLPGSTPRPFHDAPVTFWPPRRVLEQLHWPVMDMF